MQPNEVVDVSQDKSGKLFLKVFLINSDLNLAKWRIHPDYIPKHVEKFVGRPFILTQERGHPLEFENAKIDWNNINDSIGGLLQAQEKYRIGTIRKVEPIRSASADTKSQSSSSVWAAYVEVVDPKAVQAFKSGLIPRYVSPAVFRLNQSESPETTTDFEPLHLAAVDIPAYGYAHAGIRGACEGDIVHCSNALASASAPVEECGFCVKGVLDGFQNRFDKNANSSLVQSGVKQASVNLSVNSTTTDSQPQAQQSQQQPTQQSQQPQPQQPTVANINTTPQTPISSPSNIPQQPGIPQPRPEGAPFEVPKVEAKENETKPAPGNLPGQLGPSPTADNSNNDKAKTQQDEVATLRATVEALLSRVKELDSFKAESEKTTAEKLLAAKRNKIEAIIPGDYARSKEERNKAIDALMKFEDGPQLDYILEKFVTPTIAPPNPLLNPDAKGEKRGLKQAGFSESITKRVPSKRLSDYAAVPNNTDDTEAKPAIQQASIDQALILKRAARIVAMSDIVANSQYSGGF